MTRGWNTDNTCVGSCGRRTLLHPQLRPNRWVIEDWRDYDVLYIPWSFGELLNDMRRDVAFFLVLHGGISVVIVSISSTPMGRCVLTTAPYIAVSARACTIMPLSSL